ncbi:MAG: glutamine synthetase [Dehalococcoidia bacterium]|nr:glutamine synthetase [Dehalococcoidia bacterium]
MSKQDRDEAVEYVLRTIRENDVHFVRFWFTDILGNLKGFAVNVAELENALERGMGFDGSSIEGFARIDESDMVAMPDPSTFRVLPWRPKQNAVGRMFCDVLTPEGKPFEGDPRAVLKRNLERASKLGYTFYVGPELEYFYFKSSNSTEPLDVGGYFDQTPLDVSTDLRRETVLTLEEMGIPVEYSHHEVAPSQQEIDLRYTDALTMADTVMTYRLVVKEVALRHGAYASFMPKPVASINGSGMHVHMSLFQGSRNAFFDAQGPHHLSKIARCFIAGLMRHAEEITLVTNQWVNSYKRLIPGYEAPVYISWASINRSDLIRIPAYREGKEESVRIEYRAPDPACNPYLAFSVLLAAGLEGVEKEYDVPSPVTENIYEMTEEERDKRGIRSLPGSLWEAIQCAERSDVVRKALGEHVFNSFIQNKKIEWDNYRSQVTDYELKRYLPIL